MDDDNNDIDLGINNIEKEICHEFTKSKDFIEKCSTTYDYGTPFTEKSLENIKKVKNELKTKPKKILIKQDENE